MATKKLSKGQEALHKLFLAGLGLADETNHKFTTTFNALVKKGQAKEPELKKAVDDIKKKAEAKRKDIEKKFTQFVKENEIVKSKEFQTLLKRVEDFQKKGAAKAKPAAAKPAPKKVAAKKKASPKKKAAKKPAAKPAAAPAAPQA